MSRRIITQKYINDDPVYKQNLATGVGTVPEIDKYLDRLLKYIPAEAVGLWIAAKTIITKGSNIPAQKLLWICFAVGIIFTFLWTFKLTKKVGHKPAWIQIFISMGAFAVWVLATGAPFAMNPVYSSLILLVCVSGIAFFEPQE
jgi:hypothetical protein